MTTPYSDDCPTCGGRIDAHTDPDDDHAAPTAGAVSICLYCASWSVFAEKGGRLVLRLPTNDELRSIETDPGCRRVRDALLAARTRNPGSWPKPRR